MQLIIFSVLLIFFVYFFVLLVATVRASWFIDPLELGDDLYRNERKSILLTRLKDFGLSFLFQIVVLIVIDSFVLMRLFDNYLIDILAMLVAAVLISVLMIAVTIFSNNMVLNIVLPVLGYYQKILASGPVYKFLNRITAKLIDSTPVRNAIYQKDDLLSLLENHRFSPKSDIEKDEIAIASHALRFGAVQIVKVMTPISVVEEVKLEDELKATYLDRITKNGFTRLPVKDDQNEYVGVLHLNNMAKFKSGGKVKDFYRKGVVYVNQDMPLGHAFNAFLKTKKHLFLVINEFSEVTGLISLEDVLETMIGREIVDEFDRFEDMRAVAKQKAKLKDIKSLE